LQSSYRRLAVLPEKVVHRLKQEIMRWLAAVEGKLLELAPRRRRQPQSLRAALNHLGAFLVIGGRGDGHGRWSRRLVRRRLSCREIA